MGQELTAVFPAPVDGVRIDMSPFELPPTALSDSSNLVLRKGDVQARYGVAAFASDVGAYVRGAIAVGGTTGVHIGSAGSTTDVMVAGTDSAWYKYGAGAWTALTGAISASDHIIFRVFDKSGTAYVVGLNNGVDVPKKWDGTGAAISSVGGSPGKAKAMMLLANRLLLFNIAAAGGYTGAVGDSAYDVSAFNDFESGWSTTLTGFLVDTPGSIVAALEMSDLQGVVYKSDAIVVVTAQGATAPFRFEWRSTGNVGPANSRCVVAVQDGSHIFLGADGAVYRFDGVKPVSLGVHIQKYIARRVNRDLTKLQKQAFCFYDRSRNEVFVFFVSQGQTTVFEAMMISLSNLSVWPMGYVSPVTDITAGGVFQIPAVATGQAFCLFASSTGHSYSESGVSTDAGNSFSVGWTTTVTDFGAPGEWKTLTEIDSSFAFNVDEQGSSNSGTQDVLVRLVTSDGGDISSGTLPETITLSLGTGNNYITDYRWSGRRLGLDYSVICNKFFRWRGATLRARLRGRR